MMTSILEHKVTIKKLIKIALTIIFWLGLWLIAYKLVGLDVLIASPLDVAKRLLEFLPSGEFWLTIFNSFKGISLGYITRSGTAETCMLTALVDKASATHK